VSQANVEIVKRVIEAWRRRDLDAAGQDNDPDVEVDWSRSPGVEAGIYRGGQAVRDFWTTFLDTWERITVSVDEFLDCGDSVVVPNRTHFWGRDGIEVEAYGVVVVTLRDARIVQYRLFRERGEALKAVGLEA
jgi:ketosteroid isomerase-like protein